MSLNLTSIYSTSYILINEYNNMESQESLYKWLNHKHAEIVQICKVQALLSVNPSFDFNQDFIFCNHR